MKKNIVQNIKRYLSKYGKPKFRTTFLENPSPKFILDIGIANDSYEECKSVYPDSIYHCIDKHDIDFQMKVGDRFILCDLQDPVSLESLNPVYDLVIVNHVMEHLTNGEEVFKKLCNLLQTGGVLYAEFPSIRTAFKKKNGPNYHFHDDLTHISFYVLENLANIALKSGCHIISCGPSTSPPLKYMISIPRGLLNFILGKGFVRFLPSGVKKIDHIFVKKIL